ncbi:hypothetical protein Glove_232g208 [Diversispora epigaea]|uniref:Uncharacterized protein n=1 Tax=Diversispora epigaea TaxID=1348612 RepID=A0A397IC79_9GLOM|nr:hypothetical protein Glove_232g208 [Diversispora epigaea]
MGSSNLTLNRRFIKRVPELPQCLDERYSNLFYSFYIDAKTIFVLCEDPTDPGNLQHYISSCPNDTTCMDFVSDPGPSVSPKEEYFAICIDDDFIKRFENCKDGFFCKTYEINGVTNSQIARTVRKLMCAWMLGPPESCLPRLPSLTEHIVTVSTSLREVSLGASKIPTTTQES